MILAIDIGNSNIVLGAIENQNTHFISRIQTNVKCTQDEYAIAIKDILTLYGTSSADFSGSIISSVVPSLTVLVCSAIKKLLQVNPIIVGKNTITGLKISTDNPSQIGSDILMNNVAAKMLYPNDNVIIVDMGTATTISLTDKSNNFCGCAIIPGISVSLNALAKNTAQLQGIGLENPSKTIGTNTVEAMKSGIIYGTACMIDGMTQRFLNEINDSAKIIATGGHSKYIIPYCEKEIIYNENLLILGLEKVYDNNN